MLSGPEALNSISDALRDIRAEEQSVSERMARITEKVARLRETETGLFVSLAQARLDSAGSGEVSGRLSRAEKKARELIDNHHEAVEGARTRAHEIEDRLTALSADRARQSEAMSEAQAALDKLSTKVVTELEKDPAFLKEREEVTRLFDIADAALAKTEVAEADREEKGRPYRDDPLFAYLWDRGYGTRNYKANNLIRFLDNWVAKLCDYQAARPNYAMLNEIPLRLREHTETLMDRAQGAATALEAREIEAVDTAGGRTHRESVLAAQDRIEAIDAEIVALEDAREDHVKSQRQLAQGGDEALKSAVSLLAASLKHEDVSVLLSEARKTPSRTDDSLVSRIEDVRLQIAAEEVEGREDRERLKVLASRRRELEDIAYEFKKSRFDDPRSTFQRDELVGDLLSEFLRGAITASTYWGHWRQSQSWRDSVKGPGGRIGLPTGTFGGSPWGSSKPSRGSGSSWGRLPGAPSGGGFSRPRSGSSGSRRHGNFKTGGGF